MLSFGPKSVFYKSSWVYESNIFPCFVDGSKLKLEFLFAYKSYGFIILFIIYVSFTLKLYGKFVSLSLLLNILLFVNSKFDFVKELGTV